MALTDIHHPGPGSRGPSIAALVASLDEHFSRHTAAVRVQSAGSNCNEVIEALQGMAEQLLDSFCRARNGYPDKILFLRDGVSEGQFRQVRNLN